MFCAIATTIERCKTEGVVDVFQVVKALRVQKPGAVSSVVSDRIIGWTIPYSSADRQIIRVSDQSPQF